MTTYSRHFQKVGLIGSFALVLLCSNSSHADEVHRWTFEDGTDSVGGADLEFNGGGALYDGRLYLDGSDDFAVTKAPLSGDLSERTLVVWAGVDDLGQGGGGVLTVVGGTAATDPFDGIVFGERATSQWMNGSNSFLRSVSNNGGAAESVTSPETVMVAIVYGPGNEITIYREGALYSTSGATQGTRQDYAGGTSFAHFGQRHTDGSNRFFEGFIEEARIYDEALSAVELAALYQEGPSQNSAPALSPAVGTLLVEELDASSNHSSSISLSLSSVSSAGVQIGYGESGRADYFLNFPSKDDVAEGVLVSSVAASSSRITSQTAVSEAGTASYLFPDRYFIATHNVERGEANLDVSFGWFPYSDWLGAVTSAETDEGPLQIRSAAGGIFLGQEFQDLGGGVSRVDLTSLGDFSSSEGVLLVNAAANLGDFALSQDRSDGGFDVFVMDPRDNAGVYTRRPISFVYLPINAVGTRNLEALGRVEGGGTSEVQGGHYTVSKSGSGASAVWQLEIYQDAAKTIKHTFETGTLLLSNEGGGINNIDNQVSAAWHQASESWLITTYDVNGNFVQDVTGFEDVFSFAFFKGVRPTIEIDSTARTFSVDADGDGIFTDEEGVFRDDMPYEVALRGGIMHFIFGQDLILQPNDRVICKGDYPISLVAARDLVIPEGAVIDASADGVLPGPGGGLGGGGGAGGMGGAGGDGSVTEGGDGRNGGDGGILGSTDGKDGFDGNDGKLAISNGGAQNGGWGEWGSEGGAGLPGFGASGGGGSSDTLVYGRGERALFSSSAHGPGGNGGNGGDYNFVAAGANGSNGGGGSTLDGGVGAAGGDGPRGGRGRGGRNLGSGLLISGGAGGSGGRGGAGGGGGAAGGAGGGGGGGGGEAFRNTGNGESGGAGGDGGKGGDGGAGAIGTAGGQGGGGGGAVALTAYRYLVAKGTFVATGGEGGASEAPTAIHMGASGVDGENGIGGINPSRGAGGDGGDGGDGGRGGAGGDGGNGGEGGGGSGGTFKFEGHRIDTDGAVLIVTGGTSLDTEGRIIFSESGPNELFGYDFGSKFEDFGGLSGANPHLDVLTETPYLASLRGGAEVGGLLNGFNAGDFSAVVSGAPGDAVLAVMRSATFAGESYPGYDWIFLINLTANQLQSPVLGAGDSGWFSSLIDGGLATKEAFGGAGSSIHPYLEAHGVYATLIPSEVSFVAWGFENGQIFLEESADLELGILEVEYLTTPGFTVATVIPDAVEEDFISPGYPESGDRLLFTSTGELEVNIVPAEAVAAGARWQVDSQGGVYQSGELVPNVPLGVHELSFPTVPGWLPPRGSRVDVVPGGITTTVTVTFDEAASATIGAIPPQTVGESQVLGMTFAPGTSLELVSGAPEGALFITGSGWFYYEPSIEDRSPFEVRFSYGGESQVVMISPEPDLSNELEILALQPQPESLPDPAGANYNQIHKAKGEALMNLNSESTNTRIVTMSGKEILFRQTEDGLDEGRFFEAVGYYQQDDGSGNLSWVGPTAIEELRIYAETVTFESALHVPGTKVTIYAKTVNFPTEQGQLITTPLADSPGSRLDAGDVTIHALAIEGVPSDHPRFVLNGGDSTNGSGGAAGMLKTPFEGMALFAKLLGGNGASEGATVPVVLSECEDRISEEFRGYSWLHPIAVRSALAYAKDLYFLGFLTEAESEFLAYKRYLSQLGDFSHLPDDANYPDEVGCPVDPSLDFFPDTLDARLEFAELEADVDRHLARLSDKLDYYGNPAGWVPLLSLETNFLLTDAFIDNAIEALYVSYWINRSSDFIEEQTAALSEAEAQLTAENGLLNAQMDFLLGQNRTGETSGEIYELQLEESELNDLIERQTERLQELEARLLERAEDLQEEEDRKEAWKKTARTLGAVMQVVPVGQPALAAAGGGLDLVSRVDEQDSLETILDGASIVGSYQVADLRKSAKDLEESVEAPSLQSTTKQEAYNAQANDLEQKLGYLDQGYDDGNAETSDDYLGVKELQLFLGTYEAPADEIAAMLEQVKATDPQFVSMVDSISELMRRKEAFAARLLSAQNQVREIPALVMKNAIAIERLDRSATDFQGVLDPQALSVVREMERRAKDRLRKQFYLLAKAYEYRLVESYRQGSGAAFDAVDVFEKVEAIIQAPQDLVTFTNSNGNLESVVPTATAAPHIINADGFRALASIFRDELSKISTRIVDNYDTSEFEQNCDPLVFDERELEMLNGSLGQVTVNLEKSGKLDVGKEMQRIRSLVLDNVSFSLTLDGQPTTAAAIGLTAGSKVEIQVVHSGRSVITREGQRYLFNHYTSGSETENPIRWKFTVDLTEDNLPVANVSSFDLSYASESLLTTFLGDDGDLSIQRFSRPGAAADLVVKVLTPEPEWSGAPVGDVGVVIESLNLCAGIDFYESTGTEETEIRVQDPDGNPLDILPRFRFDLANGQAPNEEWGRRDGIGSITRSFTPGSFEIRPQEFYGDVLTAGDAQPNGFRFSHWISQTGGRIRQQGESYLNAFGQNAIYNNALGDYLAGSSTNGDEASRTLLVDNNQNKRFIAVYEYVGDTDPAEVQSIALDLSESNGVVTTYVVNFDEAVAGVRAEDFMAVDEIGVLEILSTTRIGNSWKVKVNGVPTSFGLVDDDSILDAAGNSLAGFGLGNGDFTYDGVTTVGSQTVTLALTGFDENGAPELQLIGAGDSSWQLQWSADLTNEGWTDLEVMTLVDGSATTTDSTANEETKRFYRVVAVE
ncbi:LamG-like jellyroll fold domain-containing protein [Roseibacillus persicicus]|uniref:LamG-like jellyroll fold domain-containing protein n=1 Tax=Roseibacillus persicicus TaxID=454148 RepID=A0A918TTK0_9BACT|nr:LamG-like jellyroll fold domain-containing protein [Roseibacillus persicicus]GHC62952.1 hypothetical protein GCM10007100_32880 [Roseibacillus persicicus]